MFKVIGIDEAGKGPVIGSMFIGFAIINLEKKEDLESYNIHLQDKGVCDSKKLSPTNRQLIFNQLKDNLDMKFVQLSPGIIDQNNKDNGKLNDLEVSAIAQIVNSEKPNLVIIDALTANPLKFKEKLKSVFTVDCEIISENKADSKYPLVSAASIIAKELREQEVSQIKNNLSIDFGSGYPSDPKTIEFLKKYYADKKVLPFVRTSWETYKKLNEKNLSSYF